MRSCRCVTVAAEGRKRILDVCGGPAIGIFSFALPRMMGCKGVLALY